MIAISKSREERQAIVEPQPLLPKKSRIRVIKPPEKSEKEIQKEILAYLRGKGMFVWVNTQGSFQQNYNTQESAGEPDIIGILREEPYKGHLLGIEVKAKGGRIRQKQEAWLNRARETGAFVFIAFSVDDVITQFKEYKVRA